MKFKVIKEKTGEVVAKDLTIREARELAWGVDGDDKAEHYISTQREETPHRNGEVVSNVVNREINKLLTRMMDQYPNDASLGAAIRIYQQNTN